MATEILQNQKVLFDGYNLTGVSNAIKLEFGREAKDETVLGASTRKNKAGPRTVSAGVSGFFDAAQDGVLAGNLGAEDKVLSLLRGGTLGDAAYMFKCLLGQYSPAGSVGELFAFDLSAASRGRLVRAKVMENYTALAATANGTGRQLGAISATQKMYAALHVTGNTGTAETLDVTIESDNNSGFTTPATRITFAQATGVGGQWQELSGAITDDYWRAVSTIGGTNPTFDFFVLLGIL